MKNLIFIDFEPDFCQILNSWHKTEQKGGHDGFGEFIVPSGVLLGDYISFIKQNIDELNCKIVLDGKNIVGFICYIKNENSLFVECMGVSPDFRGQGYSGKILTLLKTEASALGIARVTLNVHKNNSSGIRSFSKVGKRTESSSENYIDFEIQ